MSKHALVLEVGKRYVNRLCDVVLIVKDKGNEGLLHESSFRMKGSEPETHWRIDGRWFHHEESEFDLVAGYRPMPLAIVGFRR